MNRKQIQKTVASLAGEYLLPEKFPFENLGTDMGDLLVFKEELDMKFNENFDPSKILDCRNISEVTDLVGQVISKKSADKKAARLSPADLKEESLPEDIGFLLIELSANDTKTMKWTEIPASVTHALKKIYAGYHIDYRDADIRGNHQRDMYITSYADADADFSLTLILFHSRIIFRYEN